MTDGQALVKAGIRPTRQRLRIVQELAREPHDVTAQELHRRLIGSGENVGLATVYRTLTALAERGVADAMVHRQNEVCYRICGEGHHHHLVCTDCHRVVELPECGLESWLERVSEAQGFAPTEHRVEVLGLCADCR